ncbi:MAG: substrate-binding domain-containing protein [Pseudomonadota bacterium]
MKHLLGVIFVLAATALGAAPRVAMPEPAGCTDCEEDAPALRVVGTDAMVWRILPRMLEVWDAAGGRALGQAQDGTGVRFKAGDMSELVVVARPAGAAEALAALRDGAADIAVTARRARPAELTAAMVETVLAFDALSVRVGRGVGRDTLTMAELTDVLSGRVGAWASLSGRDLRVLPVLRRGGTDQRATLLAGLGLSDAALTTLSIDNDAGIAAAVETFPGAIGLASVASPGGDVVALDLGCGAPTRPSTDEIASGRYPLSRPLYLYWSEASGAALATHLTTVTAQARLSELGLVPVLPLLRKGMSSNPKLVGLSRAGPILRFDTAGDLTHASQVALAHLQSALDAGRLGRVVLVGRGPDAASRVAQVADTLDRAVETLTEAADACPDQVQGVELWAAP